MQVKTISVTYGRKFSTGNYESMTIDATLWADLDVEEDDADECMAELFAQVKAAVKEQALPVLTAQRGATAKVTEMFAGKPVEGGD